MVIQSAIRRRRCLVGDDADDPLERPRVPQGGRLLLPKHVFHVLPGLGAGLEKIESELVCQRLALGARHRALVVRHVRLVSHQNLRNAPGQQGRVLRPKSELPPTEERRYHRRGRRV